MIRASIDIGSNSVLLLVAEIVNDSEFREIANEARVTALGKGLTTSGEFAQESMKETYLVLKEYVQLVTELGIEASDIIVTATEASRVAKNAAEFYERVTSKLGIKVQIISGEGEAFYTALGVCCMAECEHEALIVDIGGASTELTSVRSKPFKLLDSISLPIGSVRASEWIEQDSLLHELRSAWAGSDSERFASDHAIFVAGTMTSLGAMLLGMTVFEGNQLGKKSITLKTLSDFVSKVSDLSPQDLKHHYPFLGKRAASIIGGAKVALFICERLNIESLLISPYGLRYGTVLEGKIGAEYVQHIYG